jgi:DNA repair exonuclease SbcCD nuclease subunit
MRIRVLSDLHLECGPFTYTPAGEDLLVLAGDIADQSRPAKRHRRALCDAIAAAGIPAVYLLGNHEFYRDKSPRRLIARRLRQDLPAGITLLDCGELDVGGIRIIGCTLWSYCGGNPAAQLAAEQGIADFHWMRDDLGDPITATTMAEWHQVERRWLAQQIDQADRPVVVVTHWQPSAASTPERFRGGSLTPYFQTTCADLLRPPVRLWIHGHVHDSVDLVERGVRIVCNPRGYTSMEVNERFDDQLTVTVSEAPLDGTPNYSSL